MSSVETIGVGFKGGFRFECDSLGVWSRDVKESREGSKSSESSCVLRSDEGVLDREDGRPRFFPINIMEWFNVFCLCF